jgi:hypothetical protein
MEDTPVFSVAYFFLAIQTTTPYSRHGQSTKGRLWM